jgi:hypothetical protein
VRAAGSWGRAIEVPGLAALNKGGYVNLTSLSCGAAGNCAAGGYYTDVHGFLQGFVVSMRRGRWGKAIEVPGLAALNNGAYAADDGAYVSSVSCAAAGNCAAVGHYLNRRHHSQGFVVSERRSRWGKAIEVPGLQALNKGVYYPSAGADVNTVSCGSAGSCAAGGFYLDAHQHRQGFVVSEKNGRWGKAIQVPGMAALTKPSSRYYGSDVISVSCASAGNCAAGGYYGPQSGYQQAFVASEKNGRWGKAIEVPGMAALSAALPYAAVDSVSCASAGSCAAGGTYNDGNHQQGFVASEHNGRWGKAINIPGLQALNTFGDTSVGSVSCTTAGNCTAGGTYNGDPDLLGSNGYVVTEKNGHWGHASNVPGLAALNKDGEADVFSVSCGSPGNCAAGGSYYDIHGRFQGFVAVQMNGTWQAAIQVPGLAALNTGFEAYVNSVSCPPASNCVAGGDYSNGHGQGFVT